MCPIRVPGPLQVPRVLHGRSRRLDDQAVQEAVRGKWLSVPAARTTVDPATAFVSLDWKAALAAPRKARNLSRAASPAPRAPDRRGRGAGPAARQLAWADVQRAASTRSVKPTVPPPATNFPAP
jgi:hypothetical protein